MSSCLHGYIFYNKAAHRRRSNTAQRLEKLKREKHKQSKIKHIQWKDIEHPVDEIGEYFFIIWPLNRI